MKSKQAHYPSLYLCGTDTGVGKSHLIASLLLSLRQRGIDAAVWKAAQSGRNSCPDGIERTDVEFCQHYGQGPALASYSFSEAISPHWASALCQEPMELAKFQADFHTLKEKHQLVLCEGAGGLMSPLLSEQCQIDFFRPFCPQALLVARDGLGTINHTLMSLELLQSRGYDVLGFVFGAPTVAAEMSAENARCISQISQVPFLGYAPQLCDNEWDMNDSCMARLTEHWS